MVKNIEDMCNRLDPILACVRQTDGRTDRQTDRHIDGEISCHGIVRAIHTRRAVKMMLNILCCFASTFNSRIV